MLLHNVNKPELMGIFNFHVILKHNSFQLYTAPNNYILIIFKPIVSSYLRILNFAGLSLNKLFGPSLSLLILVDNR